MTDKRSPDDDGHGPPAGTLGQAGADSGVRLESWKAIAAYLGRDITTVQRWERQEGLPVHRLLHTKSGSIYAFANEVDQWRRDRSRVSGGAPSRREGPAAADSEPAAQGVRPDAGPSPGADAVAGGEPDGSKSEAGETAGAAVGDLRGTPPQGAEPVRPGAPAVARRRRAWAVAALVLGTAAVAAGLGVVAFRWNGDASRVEAGTITRVAVLPLKNLLGDVNQQYFADGMTEAIIARLSSIAPIQVTSRTSVMQFREGTRSASEIARLLGVDALVEGSVAMSGDRIRVIVKLIDAERDTHIWTREFDRDLRNVLTLQGEVADAVASSVHMTATSAREQVNRTVSAEAYRRYLKGRFLLGENTRESIEQALREFESALVADASFAPAYAGLAIAYQDLSAVVIGAPVGNEIQSQATAVARRAVELDPQSAEAHSALGRSLMGQLHWAEAEAALKRALELNPSDARAHLWMAEWLLAKARPAEAVASAEHARALDPLSIRTVTAVAYILNQGGRGEQAVARWREVLERRPDYLQAEVWLGSALLAMGEATESQRRLEHAVALSDRSPWVTASLAHAYVRNGRIGEARAILTELLARSRREWVQPTAIASAYAAVGDRERVLAWLDRAITERSRGVHLLRTNWAFAGLADDPRFGVLLKRIDAE